MRRRDLLRGAVTIGGVTFLGGTKLVVESLAGQACEAPAGELVAVLPVHGDTARQTAYGEILGGSGLDARRFTDVSGLTPDRLITPTRELFLRTSAPPALAAIGTWPIAVEAIRRDARALGAHLIECSGNSDPDNFGLLSVAEWEGVPLAEFITSLGKKPDDESGVFVGGIDYSAPSRSSYPGASWVFPRSALARTGAFLAVRVNGEPLPRDHGAPVRLVVPGWYGCTWIKWVNEIRFAAPEEPVTAQMVEFSLRTHQRAVPKLARDYEPPEIDLAAMPIRVEKRRLDGRLHYRVVGIIWGGDRPVDRLAIRFRAGEAPTPFAVCPAPRTHRMWSLWEYRWQPAEPGLYSIALSSPDPSIRTRRLDVSYYVRRVFVDEV
jgi:DMSO/TMAO reductase YedYZ molybdopterin-dependent catalytic subunit